MTKRVLLSFLYGLLLGCSSNNAKQKQKFNQGHGEAERNVCNYHRGFQIRKKTSPKIWKRNKSHLPLVSAKQ